MPPSSPAKPALSPKEAAKLAEKTKAALCVVHEAQNIEKALQVPVIHLLYVLPNVCFPLHSLHMFLQGAAHKGPVHSGELLSMARALCEQGPFLRRAGHEADADEAMG